jgi:hypothetical protein
MSEGFSDQILGGVGTLIRKFIQSKNYVAGSAGWKVTSAGDAEFNNVTVRGIVDVKDAGTGNEIKIQPAGTVSLLPEIDFTLPGIDTPGYLAAFISGPGNAVMNLVAPKRAGRHSAGLFLYEETATGNDTDCQISADTLQLNGPLSNSSFCNVENNFISQGRGLHFGVGATTSLTTAAQAMALSAANNFVFKAGRVYRGKITGRINTAVTDTLAIFKLLKGTTTAAAVAVDCGGIRCLAGALMPLNVEFYLANATGADIVQTVQLSLQSNNANTVTWDGGGGNPQMPRGFSLSDVCSINEWSTAGYVTL